MSQATSDTIRSWTPRLLVATVVLLTLTGLALVGWTLTSPSHQARATGLPGIPIETEYGSFTVTRVSGTFVPNTQGPPSQHSQQAGVNGSEQLQVWIRMVNTGVDGGLPYSPDSFRLVSKPADGKPERITGSSLTEGVLRSGTSIDGRMWFDLAAGASGPRWLTFESPGEAKIRVALGNVTTAAQQPASQPPGQRTEHPHEESREPEDDGRPGKLAEPHEDGHDDEH